MKPYIIVHGFFNPSGSNVPNIEDLVSEYMLQGYEPLGKPDRGSRDNEFYQAMWINPDRAYFNCNNDIIIDIEKLKGDGIIN